MTYTGYTAHGHLKHASLTEKHAQGRNCASIDPKHFEHYFLRRNSLNSNVGGVYSSGSELLGNGND